MAQMMDSMVIESSSTATFSFPRIASNFNSANVSKAPVKRIAAASPKYVRQGKYLIFVMLINRLMATEILICSKLPNEFERKSRKEENW